MIRCEQCLYYIKLYKLSVLTLNRHWTLATQQISRIKCLKSKTLKKIRLPLIFLVNQYKKSYTRNARRRVERRICNPTGPYTFNLSHDAKYASPQNNYTVLCILQTSIHINCCEHISCKFITSIQNSLYFTHNSPQFFLWRHFQHTYLQPITIHLLRVNVADYKIENRYKVKKN